MIWHLSEAQLQDFLDEELEGEEHGLAQAHVGSCVECQTALRSMSSMVRELKSLPTQAQKGYPRWAPPESHPWLGWMRSPAFAGLAAVVLFGFGFFAGMRSGAFFRQPAADSAAGGSAHFSEAIQRQGTQYIRAIANWRRNESLAPGGEQGREVTLATLYGAAFELQKLKPQDPQVGSVVQSIGNLRDQATESRAGQEEERKP